MNFEGQQALSYHEKTKHTYFSVRTGPRFLDWRNKPYPFKVYLDAPKIALPRELTLPRRNALVSIVRRLSEVTDLGLKELATLLFFSYGITRVKEYFGEKVYFRAVPCTGALYETEIYVINSKMEGLDAGVYHFDPGEFVLVRLREGDHRAYLSKAAADPSILSSEVALILTSVAWRNAWKYGARSYRHWFWDGGVVAANAIAVANSLGLEAKVLLGFIDSEVNELLGIDGHEEAAIAILILRSSGTEPSAAENLPRLSRISFKALPYSQKQIVYDEIVEAYRSSCLTDVDSVLKWRRGAEALGSELAGVVRQERSLSVEEDAPPHLYEVILRRGSTRRFARRPVTKGDLGTILLAAKSPIPSDFEPVQGVALVDAYLIVNDVDGLEPGAYFYDHSSGSLLLLKRGTFRKVSRYLCLEQDLGGDASIVFFLMSDLGKVTGQLGNRGYRASQFEAGVRAGWIYLAAYALNLGATGLTFYDDEVKAFFSPHASQKENMLTVAVGVPAYKARPGSINLGVVKHPRT